MIAVLLVATAALALAGLVDDRDGLLAAALACVSFTAGLAL